MEQNQTSLFGDPESIAVAPVRPYAGTIGHAGSDTSADRAEREPAGARQAELVHVLECEERAGITVAELRDRYGWHHGTASGALSVLHRGGIICRLARVRQGCKVYVLPVYVDGEETEDPRRAVGKVSDCRIRRRGFTDVVEYDGETYMGAADLVRAMRGETE